MKDPITAVIGGIVLGIIAGMIIGILLQYSKDQADAVKAGKAEYYLDKDNNKQWRWKP